MTGIIDYGVGNLFSLKSSFAFLGEPVRVSSDPDEIYKADRVILPGVGAFADAAARLRAGGLDEAVKSVAKKGTPRLGICLGMQLLFSGSEQGGRHTGLAVFADRLVRVSGGTRFPHVGWNTVQSVNGCPLLKGLDMHSFYFLHDYWALDVTGAHVAGITEFGMDFCSVAHRDNVFGVQFCPEKSGEDGIRLLSNFMEIPSAKG